MKKIIVICGSILTVLAALTTILGVIDYKLKHRRYVKANIKF